MAYTSVAPLLTKKSAIRVKIETTKGSKITTDQYLFVSNLKTDTAADYIERPGVGLYRGHTAKGVIGARKGKCSFDCELRGTGAGACEAGLAILLQACGLIKAVEVYSTHSAIATDKTISIDVFQDGINKCLIGCSGTFKLGGQAGERAMFNFEFQGVWQAVVDTALPVANPSVVLPIMMQGGTFTIDTFAIKINKFELDMGADVQPREDVAAVGGIAYFCTPDVLPMLSIDPEMEVLTNGYDFYGLWMAGTAAAVSMVFRNATDKLTVDIPGFQFRELAEGERTGKLTLDVTGQCNNVTANNAVTLTFAAA